MRFLSLGEVHAGWAKPIATTRSWERARAWSEIRPEQIEIDQKILSRQVSRNQCLKQTAWWAGGETERDQAAMTKSRNAEAKSTAKYNTPLKAGLPPKAKVTSSEARSMRKDSKSTRRAANAAKSATTSRADAMLGTRTDVPKETIAEMTTDGSVSTIVSTTEHEAADTTAEVATGVVAPADPTSKLVFGAPSASSPTDAKDASGTSSSSIEADASRAPGTSSISPTRVDDPSSCVGFGSLCRCLPFVSPLEMLRAFQPPQMALPSPKDTEPLSLASARALASSPSSFDVFCAAELHNRLRVAVHTWASSVQRRLAERREFRARMSDAMTASARRAEAKAPLRPVRPKSTSHAPPGDADRGAEVEVVAEAVAGEGGNNGEVEGQAPAADEPGESRAPLSADELAARAQASRALRERQEREAYEAAQSTWMSLRAWRWMRIWHARAAESKRKQETMRSAFARLSLGEKGALYARGLSVFASRSPFWQRPMSSAAVALSEDLFWAESSTLRKRERACGAPLLRAGVFRFAFRVCGSGQGLVVGVCDASRVGPPEDAMAWGLHLAHGAVYTKLPNSHRGLLSTQQLLRGVLEVDDEEGEPRANVVDIECEVDMERRRIAFGKVGQPLVEAGVVLPRACRPWAYFWNDTDAVALLSRRQRPSAQMMALQATGGRTAGEPSPTPLRARYTAPRALGVLSPRRSLSPPVDESSYLPSYLTNEWLAENCSDDEEEEECDEDGVDPPAVLTTRSGMLRASHLSSRELLEREALLEDHVETTRRAAEARDAATGITEADRARLMAVFDELDTDASGALDASEIAAAMEALGQGPIAPDKLAVLMSEADINGNGTIEFDEFVGMFAKHRAEGGGGGFAWLFAGYASPLAAGLAADASPPPSPLLSAGRIAAARTVSSAKLERGPRPLVKSASAKSTKGPSILRKTPRANSPSKGKRRGAPKTPKKGSKLTTKAPKPRHSARATPPPAAQPVVKATDQSARLPSTGSYRVEEEGVCGSTNAATDAQMRVAGGQEGALTIAEPSSPYSPSPSPGRSPPRSPKLHSPRTSRARPSTHMWDMVHHVTHLYTDLPKQLSVGANRGIVPSNRAQLMSSAMNARKGEGNSTEIDEAQPSG